MPSLSHAAISIQLSPQMVIFKSTPLGTNHFHQMLEAGRNNRRWFAEVVPAHVSGAITIRYDENDDAAHEEAAEVADEAAKEACKEA